MGHQQQAFSSHEVIHSLKQATSSIDKGNFLFELSQPESAQTITIDAPLVEYVLTIAMNDSNFGVAKLATDCFLTHRHILADKMNHLFLQVSQRLLGVRKPHQTEYAFAQSFSRTDPAFRHYLIKHAGEMISLPANRLYNRYNKPDHETAARTLVDLGKLYPDEVAGAIFSCENMLPILLHDASPDYLKHVVELFLMVAGKQPEKVGARQIAILDHLASDARPYPEYANVMAGSVERMLTCKAGELPNFAREIVLEAIFAQGMGPDIPQHDPMLNVLAKIADISGDAGQAGLTTALNGINPLEDRPIVRARAMAICFKLAEPLQERAYDDIQLLMYVAKAVLRDGPSDRELSIGNDLLVRIAGDDIEMREKICTYLNSFLIDPASQAAKNRDMITTNVRTGTYMKLQSTVSSNRPLRQINQVLQQKLNAP